jgi:hypothetical protein
MWDFIKKINGMEYKVTEKIVKRYREDDAVSTCFIKLWVIFGL